MGRFLEKRRTIAGGRGRKILAFVGRKTDIFIRWNAKGKKLCFAVARIFVFLLTTFACRRSIRRIFDHFSPRQPQSGLALSTVPDLWEDLSFLYKAQTIDFLKKS